MEGSPSCICTVLLITYNHKKYIRKAIESVLTQKTQYQFKIHIFDDASSDGTSDIVREYAEKHPDLITAFISAENQGAQNNFWSAYRSVDTKYCAVLECDDYWCGEDKLQLQITALEKHPECSFCAHNTRIININDGYRRFEDNTLLVNSSAFQREGVFSLNSLDMLYSGYMNHLNSRVIRMCCVDFEELEDKETLLYDNAQFFYLLSKGFMYYINTVMSVYVQTGNGTFSGEDIIHRVRTHVTNLLQVNVETDHVAEKVIYEHLNSFIGYNLWLDDVSKGKRPAPISVVERPSRLKSLLKAILPPFITNFIKWCKNKVFRNG